MSIAVCINGQNTGVYPSRPLDSQGKTALDYVRHFAESIENVSSVFYLSPDGSLPGDYPWKAHKCITLNDFIDFAFNLPADFEHIMWIFNDCPLIDSIVAKDMLADHYRYRAEYTFAEGYPLGFAPEILSRDGIIHLKTLAGENIFSPGRTAIFDLVSRDINTFDLETKISKKDMRAKRLVLGMETRQEYLQTKNILEACLKSGGKTDEETLTRVVFEREDLQRTLPSYVSVQLTHGCLQACSCCPFPKMNPGLLETREIMSIENYAVILDKISAFMESGTLNFSPFGEPSLHPRINEIIDMTVRKGFRVILETSGLGWAEEKSAALLKLIGEYGNRIAVIVSLDANEKLLYEKIRGKGFSEAFTFAENMVCSAPDCTYIQCVRMNENEDYLEPFYRFWKEKTDNIIIQKYDSYCGYMPENVVSDISPLTRNVCWHLKRDMTVLLNGDVPLCREDLSASRCMGNLLTGTPEEIWERGNEILKRHMMCDYPQLCEKCDEYYTFNV